jgi:hypothetical protein
MANILPSGINHLATIVAALAAFAASFVWFTIVFRAPYLAGLGKSQEELDRGPSMVEATLLQFMGFVLAAYAMAWLTALTGRSTLGGGLTIALIAWLGFVAAVVVPMYAFQAFFYQFSAIVVGGYLVALLIIGAIVGVWR